MLVCIENLEMTSLVYDSIKETTCNKDIKTSKKGKTRFIHLLIKRFHT